MSSTKKRDIPFTGSTYRELVTWMDDNGGDPSRDRGTGELIGSLNVFKSDNEGARLALTGIQITESEAHPAWRNHKRGFFGGDMGGPFFSSKRYVTDVKSDVHLQGRYLTFGPPRGHNAIYDGICLPTGPSNMVFPDYPNSSDKELAEAGSIAISRCSPATPAVNILQFLGELYQEGLPHMIGSGLQALRGLGAAEIGKILGHEYLNVEFGWKPFVSDLRSIASLILRMERELQNFERNSGKLVRRRYEFPPSVSYDSGVLNLRPADPWISGGDEALYDPNGTPNGQVSWSQKTVKNQWFSGAFAYYIPPSDTLRNTVARYVIEARKLLGLSLTPDTVWSLVPWSWAVDWFTDVRELLNNWTNWAIDNQVLAYAYVMEHSISERTYTYSGTPTFRTSGVVPPPITFTSEVKLRVKGTPFGFGLDWGDFTPTQLAIAAALGLTKGR